MERLTHEGVNHAEEQKNKQMELKSELRKATKQLETCHDQYCMVCSHGSPAVSQRQRRQKLRAAPYSLS